MILFEGIFSLLFCLVRQPSLNFTVSSSTDKGSEVTFFFLIGRLAYCQICLSVSRLCNAEARIKWQESSCYFTNATFQLSARSDTLKHAQPMLWGFVFGFGFCSFVAGTSRGSSHGRHLGLFLSKKGHFGRGHVLCTLSHDGWHPHIYSCVPLLSNMQLSKKKKKKEEKLKGGTYALERIAHEGRLE